MSVYNVHGSQNEFVERVTRVFILRMRSIRQNCPLQRNTVFAVARIGLMVGIFFWGGVHCESSRGFKQFCHNPSIQEAREHCQ